MRFAIVSAALLSAFVAPTPARAFNCDPCDSQCEKGFLKNVDPICFAACVPAVAAACWDVSNPGAAAFGEMGAQAYQFMSDHLSKKNPTWEIMDREIRDVLYNAWGYNFADLVHRVRIHWGSWLPPGIGYDWYEIAVEAGAQTFGYDIYIRARKEELTPMEQITVLAHELVHTWQYVQRGENLAKFGRDYFEGWFLAGMSYEKNHMELQAEEVEKSVRENDSIKAAAQRITESKPWNFQVCNKSGYDTIYVATATWDEGLTLVGSMSSNGWFAIRRDECRMLNNNVQEVYAYAFVQRDGHLITWGNGAKKFCVKHTPFSFSHLVSATTGGTVADCSRQDPTSEAALFTSIPNPWKTQGSDTFTWTLTGEETRLRLCNESGESQLMVALLRGDFDYWFSEGWFVLDDRNRRCVEVGMGSYTGPVWVYGESFGASRRWEVPSELGFCVHHPDRFKHVQSQPCRGTGASLVHGHKTELHSGLNTFTFGS
ncbi:DUF1036 domain-containing protein [Sorangium sp. So ce1335]|uniref:DUF1036 domain-containing protein n=1 Tax=Sorangium sp. So ce1335 TaxID=3133335 RepID=UPI003F5ECCC1